MIKRNQQNNYPDNLKSRAHVLLRRFSEIFIFKKIIENSKSPGYFKTHMLDIVENSVKSDVAGSSLLEISKEVASAEELKLTLEYTFAQFLLLWEPE
jgi:hypothetical protein